MQTTQLWTEQTGTRETGELTSGRRIKNHSLLICATCAKMLWRTRADQKAKNQHQIKTVRRWGAAAAAEEANNSVRVGCADSKDTLGRDATAAMSSNKPDGFHLPQNFLLKFCMDIRVSLGNWMRDGKPKTKLPARKIGLGFGTKYYQSTNRLRSNSPWFHVEIL